MGDRFIDRTHELAEEMRRVADPVAVDAGLMAEADALMDASVTRGGSIATNWRDWPADKRLRDLVAAALQAAEERGAERMRDRAEEEATEEAAAVEALDAFEVGPHAVMAKAQGRHTATRIATAIRALPLSETEK